MAGAQQTTKLQATERVDAAQQVLEDEGGGACLQMDTEYSLDIFHCERQTQGSNFKITTRGIVLSTASSVDPT